MAENDVINVLDDKLVIDILDDKSGDVYYYSEDDLEAVLIEDFPSIIEFHNMLDEMYKI